MWFDLEVTCWLSPYWLHRFLWITCAVTLFRVSGLGVRSGCPVAQVTEWRWTGPGPVLPNNEDSLLFWLSNLMVLLASSLGSCGSPLLDMWDLCLQGPHNTLKVETHFVAFLKIFFYFTRFKITLNVSSNAGRTLIYPLFTSVPDGVAEFILSSCYGNSRAQWFLKYSWTNYPYINVCSGYCMFSFLANTSTRLPRSFLCTRFTLIFSNFWPVCNSACSGCCHVCRLWLSPFSALLWK